jgi:phage RecT family recombinase
MANENKAAAPAVRTLSVVVREILTKRLADVAAVLPPQMVGKADWFIRRACMTLTMAEGPLANVTPASFALAVLQGAEVGLPIDNKLAYAVPYKNGALSRAQNRDVYEAKFQPSFVGLATVAKRSGQITHISAGLVFANDYLEHGRFGPDLRFIHRAVPPNQDAGEFVAAYAITKFPGGDWEYTLMTAGEIGQVQRTSKASRDDSPWKQWPGEMRKKTVLKRALKLYCSDPGYVLAAQRDDEAEFVKPEAAPRISASQVGIPGIYEPPAALEFAPAAEEFDFDVSASPAAAMATPASQEPPAANAGSAVPDDAEEQILFDLSARLDQAETAAGVDAAQRWALQALPAALHGTVASMCVGRRGELKDSKV